MTSVVRNQICCTNMKHRGALHNVDRLAAVQPLTLSTWSRYTDTSLYGRSPRAAAAATEWAFLASLFWNDFVLHILQYFCSHLSLHRACSSPSRHAKESNSRASRMLKKNRDMPACTTQSNCINNKMVTTNLAFGENRRNRLHFRGQ